MRISMTRCAARSVPAIVALFAAPASRDSRAIAVCTSLYFVEAGFPIPICMFRYIHHTEGETAGRHAKWQSLARERAARDDASGPKKTELGLRPTLRFIHFIRRAGVPRCAPPLGPARVVSHGKLGIETTRVPRELLPVSPLVERLQQRDAAVDRRLGVEEEHLGEDLVGAVGGG